MTDTNTNNATTEGDSDNAPVTMSDLKAVLAEMKAETSKMINGGLESRVKKIVEPILSAIKPKDEPKAEENETESDAPAKGESMEMRKLRTQLASLQAKQKEIEERATAKERESKRRDREARLRNEIAQKNLSDPEAAFALALAKLKVGEDDEFFAEGENGSVLSVTEFIPALVKSHPILTPPSGKDGNGSPNASNGSNRGRAGYDPKLSPSENAKRARTAIA